MCSNDLRLMFASRVLLILYRITCRQFQQQTKVKIALHSPVILRNFKTEKLFLRE